MKKSYNSPKLSVHGSIEVLTEQRKTFGKEDGVVLVIPNVPVDIPIGSL
jgi:hypothetical protein